MPTVPSANRRVATVELPSLIRTVFDAAALTAKPLVIDGPRSEPAVSVRASIRPDHLVCLENDATLKMLKRYLRTLFDMSPHQYRAKWDLPADCPMAHRTTPPCAATSLSGNAIFDDRPDGALRFLRIGHEPLTRSIPPNGSRSWPAYRRSSGPWSRPARPTF